MVAGGDDGKKTVSNTVDVFTANSTAGGKGTTFKLGAALKEPRVACLGERFVVVAGGIDGSQCSSKAYLLDTQALPAADAALPILPASLTGKVTPQLPPNVSPDIPEKVRVILIMMSRDDRRTQRSCVCVQGQVAVASDGSSTAVFFDGVAADVAAVAAA